MEMYDESIEWREKSVGLSTEARATLPKSQEIDRTIESIIHMRAHAKDLREARQREQSRKSASAPATSTMRAVFPAVLPFAEETVGIRAGSTVKWSELFDSIVGKEKSNTVTNDCM